MSEVPFERLIEMYAVELLGYLRRLTGSREDAEDCIQEAFLRAYRAFPSLRPDSNPRAWLYTIASRVAYSHGRRAARRRHALAGAAPLTSQRAQSAESQAEQAELLQAVRAFVRRMPHKQRAALVMRRYQGLGYEVIGEVLGCSPEAARASAYQALKKLRAHFAEEVSS